MITGDPTFLSKYEEGQQRYSQLLNALRELVPLQTSEYGLIEAINTELI
ncbi:CHASE3 domain-containing protein [uncultured Chloroflexus sp.]|nr:CHASE3 domain-containing protein [uncultured Chloroflexus sp.]